ncbi:MAG: UbiA family prenyltransferase, partial [Candidatus Deferrimicrobiaceae bacterium]
MGERGQRGRGDTIPAPELTPPEVPSAILLVKPGIVAAVTLAGFSGMVLAGRGVPPPGKTLLTLSCILAAAGGSAALNSVLDAGIDEKMPRLTRRTAALRAHGRGNVAAAGIAAIAA